MARKVDDPDGEGTLRSAHEKTRTTAPSKPRTDEAQDRLLNVREAATLLGLKPATLYQWAYERRIPVVKPSGPRGPLRFRLKTLLKLIEGWERPALRPLRERQ